MEISEKKADLKFLVLLHLKFLKVNNFFSKLRMIDISEFQSQHNAIDLPIFLNSCMKNIEFAKDQLAKK